MKTGKLRQEARAYNLQRALLFRVGTPHSSRRYIDGSVCPAARLLPSLLLVGTGVAIGISANARTLLAALGRDVTLTGRTTLFCVLYVATALGISTQAHRTLTWVRRAKSGR